MVSIRRPSVHHRCLGHGVIDGPWPRIPLLGPRAAKICPIDDVGMHGRWIRHYIPVVPVGILLGFLANGAERLYWGPQAVWVDGHIGKP